MKIPSLLTAKGDMPEKDWVSAALGIWIPFLPLPLPCCVTWGESLSLSMPELPDL